MPMNPARRGGGDSYSTVRTCISYSTKSISCSTAYVVQRLRVRDASSTAMDRSPLPLCSAHRPLPQADPPMGSAVAVCVRTPPSLWFHADCSMDGAAKEWRAANTTERNEWERRSVHGTGATQKRNCYVANKWPRGPQEETESTVAVCGGRSHDRGWMHKSSKPTILRTYVVGTWQAVIRM